MKILKWVLFFLLILIVAGVFGCFMISEDRPAAQPTNEADLLAQKMLDALQFENFKKTKFLRWNFGGRTDYFFDQEHNRAVIEWKENKVLLQLDTQQGTAYSNGNEVTGEKKQELIDKAWSNWCNDSFWMLAPFKVFDPGTTRSIVKDDDGRQGLMIEYQSGGVTPGDGYLWLLDENHIPTGYKMWTSIIPVKGMYASWEDWKEVNGALYSTTHNLGMKLEMQNFLASDNIADFGYSSNPFE